MSSLKPSEWLEDLTPIARYGYYKPKKKAEAKADQAVANSAASAKSAATAADERRRQRLLLLNPSANTQQNQATGRSQLLGV